MYRSVFKTKAGKLEKALVALGHEVSVNSDKPRKGCFVVNVEGSPSPAVELLSMPRPFKELRELDLDALIARIDSGEDTVSTPSSSICASDLKV